MGTSGVHVLGGCRSKGKNNELVSDWSRLLSGVDGIKGRKRKKRERLTYEVFFRKKKREKGKKGNDPKRTSMMIFLSSIYIHESRFSSELVRA